MKTYKNILLFLSACLLAGNLFAQDPSEATSVKKAKPVKNTFGSVWLMDNQTVLVPIKGTLEFDIQHRFGTVDNGKKDLWGLFAPSNIRLGLGYSPINKLFVGAGITKERMQVDLNAKYALLQQTTDNKMPVSVSYFGNAVIDARDKSNFRYGVHRFSYFNQLIIARKITEKFSAQVAPSFSWYNNVEAYVDDKGEIKKKMENGHFAISVLGRYKITEKSAIIVGYDQPLTQHTTNNPHPNICFGFETTTSSHAFQVFAGNYYGIVPQSNNVFNQNDYRDGQFVIGFNITRLWNF
jgi:Membrane bound beta barrel domain (DUF5777)